MRAHLATVAILLLITLPGNLLASDIQTVETGYASWYGGHFQGRRTANGEIFDTNQLTAAHKTLPFDSIVRVINLQNEQSVVVRINDRGPFVEDRIIDLSRAAADAIDLTAAGVGPVRLEVLHLQQDTALRSIQVGSYSVRRNAQDVAGRLRENGLRPVIQQVANRRIYRVLIQGVMDEEIPEYRSRLARLGFSDVLIRQK